MEKREKPSVALEGVYCGTCSHYCTKSRCSCDGIGDGLIFTCNCAGCKK